MNMNTTSTANIETIRQHRKPICNSQGHCIGYSDWKTGGGLPWWPHRDLSIVVNNK